MILLINLLNKRLAVRLRRILPTFALLMRCSSPLLMGLWWWTSQRPWHTNRGMTVVKKSHGGGNGSTRCIKPNVAGLCALLVVVVPRLIPTRRATSDPP